MGGMQRYGPTERAVTLWGHEIACLWPFGDMKHDMKLLTLLPLCANFMLCILALLYLKLDQLTRDFSLRPGVRVRFASLIAPVFSSPSL